MDPVYRQLEYEAGNVDAARARRPSGAQARATRVAFRRRPEARRGAGASSGPRSKAVAPHQSAATAAPTAPRRETQD
jgi:hypothetical protein